MVHRKFIYYNIYTIEDFLFRFAREIFTVLKFCDMFEVPYFQLDLVINFLRKTMQTEATTSCILPTIILQLPTMESGVQMLQKPIFDLWWTKWHLHFLLPTIILSITHINICYI
jgi:hypothetical protein